MPASWITGAIFPIMVLSSIFLTLIAFERANMTMSWVWALVTCMVIVVRLVALHSGFDEFKRLGRGLGSGRDMHVPSSRVPDLW
jgi:hypothetical protein